MRIRWACPPTELPEDQGSDMTSPAFQKKVNTRRYIVVRFIGRAPATIVPGAIGYSLPFARTGAQVLIFYDRVEFLAQNMNQATYMVSCSGAFRALAVSGNSGELAGGGDSAAWRCSGTPCQA
jgi:hypothetical protein